MLPSVRFVKRLIDVSASLAGLVVAAPLVPLIAAAVYADDPGPVFYRQRRAGMLKHFENKEGMNLPVFEEFDMFKFRTMRTDAEKFTGAVLAQENDPRITRVGRIRRKSRLDELPQLWNIFKGEMSLVGPRPERPELFENLFLVIPFFEERMRDVKPGLTGLWQVSGKNQTTFSRMVELDINYTRNQSIWMDLWILTKTPRVVLGQVFEMLRRVSRSKVRTPESATQSGTI